MKQALVLCGGGARGAYEVGCYKALKELGFHFDIVCGTSIGAFNGLLIAQEDDEALFDLWNKMTLDMIFTNPVTFDFSIESLMKNNESFKPFIKSYLTNKGADNEPLKAMVRQMYKPEQAKNSSIDYGLVTVQFPQMKAIEITKQEMQANEIIEYAIASASCFPAFPVHYIDEQGYIDGGYYDNLPIHLALNMGADTVLAIELEQEYTHPHFLGRTNIDIIRPSHDLGGFMDFSRELLDWRIQLGYLDTMKHFHKLLGYSYAFTNDTIDLDISRNIHNFILNYESQLNQKQFKVDDHTPLLNILKKDITHTLSLTDYFILSLELFMNYLDYPVDCIYSIKDIIDDIVNYDAHIDDEFSFIKLGQSIKDISTKQLYHLYIKQLLQNEKIMYENLFTTEYLLAYITVLFKQSKI